MSDEVEVEMKRLRQLQYMENVKKLGGKTFAEVCQDFEAEMDELKRQERRPVVPRTDRSRNNGRGS